MVQIARGDDNMSGVVEEMTGYKSVREGFAKSWQPSREKIQANKGNYFIRHSFEPLGRTRAQRPPPSESL